MKCFKWRTADKCGPENSLKCALRQRTNLDAPLTTYANSQSVVLLSPGFERQEHHGAYYNRNFCIYNISLNCQHELVDLTPFHRTTNLSDADTCEDYLSFHVRSHKSREMTLCGSDVMNPTKYQTIPSSSFYGVLWSNHNMFERGKFEIQASCKTPASIPELLGSGDKLLIPN